MLPVENAQATARVGEAPAQPRIAAQRAADPLRRLFAEVLGTFALTFVAAGGEVIAAVTGEVSRGARMVAPGLVVMALIYAIGNVSGAHLNPAVTLSFALRGSFPWHRVPGYWVAQVLAAILATLLLRALFGPVNELGATRPQVGVVVALVVTTPPAEAGGF